MRRITVGDGGEGSGLFDDIAVMVEDRVISGVFDENRLDHSGGVCILAGNTEREK